MPSLTNYQEACKRHFSDACFLQENERMPNAGQLFGVSAECGIKAFLVSIGYPTDDDGGVEKKHESYKNFCSHIDTLQQNLDDLMAFAQGRGYAKYIAIIKQSVSDFDSWKIAHRYYTEMRLPTDVQKWHKAAEKIGIMLDQMHLDGIR